MEARKAAKLKMYHQVIKLCEDNAAIIVLSTAFETSYHLLRTIVNQIVLRSEKLQEQKGGLQTSKRVAKRKLAKMCSGLAGRVYAYAAMIHDEVLQGAMDITTSDIINSKDEEVGPKCMNVYKAALAKLGVLGDYGVTADLLTDFETAINGYTHLAPKPVMSRKLKQAERIAMYKLFEEADAVLNKRMDKLAFKFLNNNNALFYAEYNAARKMTKPGAFTTVLKILAVNGANNKSLKNVRCYRDGAPVKRGSKKGFVTYKNIAQGYHRFKLKCKGFADVSAEVMMSHAEKKVVQVMMRAK